jgi:hypothetical protein
MRHCLKLLLIVAPLLLATEKATTTELAEARALHDPCHYFIQGARREQLPNLYANGRGSCFDWRTYTTLERREAAREKYADLWAEYIIETKYKAGPSIATSSIRIDSWACAGNSLTVIIGLDGKVSGADSREIATVHPDGSVSGDAIRALRAVVEALNCAFRQEMRP